MTVISGKTEQATKMEHEKENQQQKAADKIKKLQQMSEQIRTGGKVWVYFTTSFKFSSNENRSV